MTRGETCPLLADMMLQLPYVVVSISSPHQNLDTRFVDLSDARLDDGGGVVLALDGAGRGTASLNRLDDAHRGGIAVRDTAKDDVTAVEPRGHDGGDEELGAVAVVGQG